MVHIFNRLGMLACAAALTLSGAVHAATYDVSYTFSDGSTIAGTVDGDLVGTTLENLTGLRLSYNGASFDGAATLAAWDPATSSFTSTAATLSTDASLNEFVITDGTLTFGFINDDNVGGQEVFASNVALDTDNASFDSPANASWSITAAPIPEPASAALLLAGLGLAGAAAVRRRQA